MQATKPKLKIFSDIELKQALEEQIAACTDAEYLFSNIEDTNSDKTIIIPAIRLRNEPENKSAYMDTGLQTRWDFIHDGLISIWLFLHMDFDGIGSLNFKFNLNDGVDRAWVEGIIKSNGLALLCDKGEAGFDIGISNIAIDIPIISLMARKKINDALIHRVAG